MFVKQTVMEIQYLIYYQAFEICLAGDKFNLSYQSITSQEAQVLLCDVQKNNPDLWSMITHSQYSDTTIVTEAGSEEPAYPDASEDDGIEDGTEVPVDVVLEWMAFGGKVILPQYKVRLDGTLTLSNTSEEYESEEILDDEKELIEYGQGKQKRVYNKHYSEYWRH